MLTTGGAAFYHRNVEQPCCNHALTTIRGGASFDETSLLQRMAPSLPPITTATVSHATITCMTYAALWSALNPQGYFRDIAGVDLGGEKEDGISSFKARWAGWACLGIPMACILKQRALLRWEDAAVLSMLPATLYFVHHGMLSGRMDQLGYSKESTLLTFVYSVILWITTLLEVPYVHLAYIPMLLSAVYAQLFPNMAADDIGLSLEAEGKGSVFSSGTSNKALPLVWVYHTSIVMGFLMVLGSFWYGLDIPHSLRNVVLLWLATALDAIVFRQQELSRPKSRTILTLLAITASLLTFLPEK